MTNTESTGPASITKKPAIASKKLPAQAEFAKLVRDLAAADADARATSADASQARGQRSVFATATILAAHSEKVTVEEARTQLIDSGVLKGTASKVCTVIAALYDGTLSREDVTSLNAAYGLVQHARKMAKLVAAGVPTTAPGSAPAAAPVAEKPTTPKEAVKVIMDYLESLPNETKKNQEASKWLTTVTNQISDFVAKVNAGSDED